MKIHPAAQGSLEWMLARSGIPTASEFDNLLTPEFRVRTGQTPQSYLARKVAEAWIGGPLPGFQTLDMEFGQILEREAIPWYELETGETVERVGLVTTDDGRIGCSPDGLIGADGGLECKCPEAGNHVKYLLAGEVPKDYLCQIHGAMFVTGREHWTFLSYRRHFPAFLRLVKRDEEIQEKISEALTDFLADFDDAMLRLTEINGGPPRRAAPTTPKPTLECAEDDVPT